MTTPLTQSPTKADEQCRLIEVVEAMTRAISLQRPSESVNRGSADPHTRQ
ncbi:MAG: hypothetical protein V1844_24135 [Pseudomonadota bacterium]